MKPLLSVQQANELRNQERRRFGAILLRERKARDVVFLSHLAVMKTHLKLTQQVLDYPEMPAFIRSALYERSEALYDALEAAERTFAGV
jgi:hypothetical protein